MRFLDLCVYSADSVGRDIRSVLEARATELGSSIRFCDGAGASDGLEIVFEKQSDLKKQLKPALYTVLEPRSDDAASAAMRVTHTVIRTRLNPVLARAMANNNCSIELSLAPLIGTFGVKRTRALGLIRTNLKYARKYGVQILATTGAKSSYGLRSPHQVYELLKVLGLTEDEARTAMYTNPLNVILHGERAASGKVISDDVRLV
jgi:RNase P/RNase MRP subunit p30